MKTQTTFEAALMRNMAVLAAAPEFRTDSKGRKVRLFTAMNPLSFEQVREFYLSMRVVHEDEALETIGYNGLRTQVASGYLREDQFMSGRYWVTKKAAEMYKLPPVKMLTGCLCYYKD